MSRDDATVPTIEKLQICQLWRESRIVISTSVTYFTVSMIDIDSCEFPHKEGETRLARNFAETDAFHKIYGPKN